MTDSRDRMSAGAFGVTVVGAPIATILAGLAVVADRAGAEPGADDATGLARILGVGALLVTLTVLVVVVADRRRRRRRRTELDELTGLPTAADLERWTGSLLKSDEHDHHVVAVVRVEQLDLVATVFGERLRNRVVVDVANRLRAGVAWLTGGRADATATLLATGPGEFVVSLHARTAIDVDLVRRVLTLRSGRVLVFGGERVPVTWAIGLGDVRAGVDVGAIVAQARADSYLDRPVEPGPRRLVGAPLSFQRAA